MTPDDSEIAPTQEQSEIAHMTEEAFRAWHQNDMALAHELYRSLHDRFPHDHVARLYIERCNRTIPERLAKSVDCLTLI
jgi:hypothetical protein